MRIWVVNFGEPLPTDGDDVRLRRAGTLARILAERGNDVIWWTSTFDHVRKLHRFCCDTDIRGRAGFTVRLMRTRGYRKNVSLGRLCDHAGCAIKFRRRALCEQRPDLIVASLPTLELAAASCAIGRRLGIPVVIDIRDLHPDIFEDALPRPLRPGLKLLLWPYRKLAAYCCRTATALCAPAQYFLDWGLRHAGRMAAASDRVFPFGYSDQPPSADSINKAESFWAERGVRRGENQFVACFFGYLGRQFDLESVIQSVRGLNASGRNVTVVICGTGEMAEHYQNLASDCKNVVFPGWVNSPEIWTLMRLSNVGLAPYRECKNFNGHIPNKPIEYLSAGLPVFSSINGELGRLLTERKCGLVYPEGGTLALTAAFCRLYDDPAVRAEMSANSRALFAERFTAEAVYGNMADFLEQLAAGTALSGRRQ